MDYDRFLLEVDDKTDLTLPVIKKAYRRLLKKYHPDLNKNDLEYTERIIKINDAYHRLLKKLGQGSGHPHINADQIVSQPNDKEGLVHYSDQAYAFYKQGFIHFNNITSVADPLSGMKLARAEVSIKTNEITRRVKEESKEIADLVSKQLFHSSRAIYYFSIVRNEYGESEWAYDSHCKIIHIKKYLEKNLTMIKEFIDNRRYEV